MITAKRLFKELCYQYQQDRRDVPVDARTVVDCVVALTEQGRCLNLDDYQAFWQSVGLECSGVLTMLADIMGACHDLDLKPHARWQIQHMGACIDYLACEGGKLALGGDHWDYVAERWHLAPDEGQQH
ncbi:hypothetical protein APZ41_018755 [Roseomonas mucosa]|uniref:Uncharacterized protein n=1 Tax=Roseomonas mucosa TaxID=207340 RepID=A0A1S8D018_9PROT|nr:hypothetical protein [Roseomonas mucosa]ONH81646.1 hypothetical protein APZ41_018755 [Roseomonas mucosa]